MKARFLFSNLPVYPSLVPLKGSHEAVVIIKTGEGHKGATNTPKSTKHFELLELRMN